MKNFRLLLTLFMLSTFSLCLYAQPCDPADPDCDGTPPPPTNTPGNQATPIDDYAPLLIITAISIAGVISYNQKELIRK